MESRLSNLLFLLGVFVADLCVRQAGGRRIVDDRAAMRPDQFALFGKLGEVAPNCIRADIEILSQLGDIGGSVPLYPGMYLPASLVSERRFARCRVDSSCFPGSDHEWSITYITMNVNKNGEIMFISGDLWAIMASRWRFWRSLKSREGGISFADDPYQVRLRDFKLLKSERFLYEYDMGDWWQHDIRLEQTLPLDPKKRYPVCTKGDGDCPPEDCGGPIGFQNLLEERFSWSEFQQAREDMLLVAQRLLDVYQGAPPPTYEDDEFVEALERMREREEDMPIPFDRREVNAALRQIGKETPCTSESKS